MADSGGQGSPGDQNSNTVKSVADLPVETPRKDLISTAVKFLQNPKVVESLLEQKKAFLFKKGLTNEEVEIAIRESGADKLELNRQAQRLQASTTQTLQPYNNAQIPAPPSPSGWSKWRDYLATAVVIGGVSYGAYALVKKFIAPHFKHTKQDEQLERIDKTVLELQTNVATTLDKIQETMTSIETLLTRQQTLMENMNGRLGVGAMTRNEDSHAATEIKGEIASLKGLLLGRRQFPPTPVQSPVLPSWQLTAKDTVVVAENDEETKTGDVDPAENPDDTVLNDQENSVNMSSELITDKQQEEPKLETSIQNVMENQNGDISIQTGNESPRELRDSEVD